MKKIILLCLFGLLMCSGQTKVLSPYFTLTKEDLEGTLSGLPEETGTRILEAPALFLGQIREVMNEPGELLWLVDKKHSLPGGYVPPDLVDLSDYPVTITKKSLEVRKLILPQLLDMLSAAREVGAELAAASCYRSYAYQDWLFNYWVEELGLEQAEIESARPGTSQHQLGTTIDFHPIEEGFAGTPGGKWIAAHGWEYGFTLSYPEGYLELTGYKYEPWHWRYTGKAAAAITENFFGGIQQYFLEYWYEYKAFFTGKIVSFLREL